MTRNPRHWAMDFWNRGSRAGMLTVLATDGPAIIDSFIPHDEQTITPEF